MLVITQCVIHHTHRRTRIKSSEFKLTNRPPNEKYQFLLELNFQMERCYYILTERPIYRLEYYIKNRYKKPIRKKTLIFLLSL